MKKYKKVEDINNFITDEMLDFYEKRTNKHIKLVQKYCDKLCNYVLFNNMPLDMIFYSRGKRHDISKFLSPEYEPYVLITWDYKCKSENKKFDLPDSIREQMNNVSNLHIRNNSHHPEYHCDQIDNFINREDRDAIPDKMIDATKMSDIDIMEMVADWCAMSEEKGTNTPREWADKNINIRWKFTKEQIVFIYKCIDKVWED
jgi:hypothetical protein